MITPAGLRLDLCRNPPRLGAVPGDRTGTNGMSAEPAAPATAPNAYDAHGQATTRRGIATVAFSFAFWGLLVFWWYPFGLLLGTAAVVLGGITWALGIRAGKDGEHLSIGAVLLGSTVIGLALSVHRVMQVYFEGSAITLP